MPVAKMTPFLISLASCWVLGGATVKQKSHWYDDIHAKDKMFAGNLTFDSPARSALDCARQCSQHDSCVTFTFDQNSCRGHNVLAMQNATSAHAPGARTYARKADDVSSRVRCKKTGVKRLTDASLGLDTDVYCNGHWLVFQKRQDGSEDFYRKWQDYVTGFGDAHGEYWLGLEPLHIITTLGVNFDLRVDLMKVDGTNTSAVYSNFNIGPAADNYTLNYKSFLRGDTGDVLNEVRGMPFTTRDADHDELDAANCAVQMQGAWWYRRCALFELNRVYYTFEFESGLSEGSSELKACQMMIRPAD